MKNKIMIIAAAVFLLSAGCAGDKKQDAAKDGSETQKELTSADERTKTDAEPSDASDTVNGSETQQEAENSAGAKGGKEAQAAQGQDDAALAQSLINPDGMTLAERILVPDGYERKTAQAGSLAEYLRNYPMKKDGSPVLLYDGTPKGMQDDHAAVFALPLENEDLQQCADSVMRMYAEYFWDTGQYDQIGFHFTNGFYAPYVKWRDGGRIVINGSEAAWTTEAAPDDSYENFQKYLRIVFSYAGTLSMDAESVKINRLDIAAGDVFLEGGSPGHVVMLADVCEDGKGRRAFLLAQGYMPAQEFHVLKNPLHEEDPWYYADEVEYPFVTPEYVFEKGSLRRLDYSPMAQQQ